MLNRRHLITGLISLVAAPAIVRAASIMPVRSVPMLSAHHNPAFVAFGSYAVGDVVRFDGLYYVCTMAGVVSTFDSLGVFDRRATGLWFDKDWHGDDWRG